MNKASLTYKITNAVREGFRFHGAAFPFVTVHRFGLYLKRRYLGPHYFRFQGVDHRYHVHPFVLDNERAVEVAIARDWLTPSVGEILEIGNVLSNFVAFPHDVVDKYERAPGVINEDIVTFAPGKQYDQIVSISTLEHVGWDEQPREPEKIERAIANLRRLVKPGGRLLATMPMGYNQYLDRLIRAEKTGFDSACYLRRTSASNLWCEAKLEEVASAQFGTPFNCANALFVGFMGSRK